jgi:hypothetical protein
MDMPSVPVQPWHEFKIGMGCSKMPEHHRLVFNLYVLEKFSHSRIGEALGISEGTSKSHFARARKKLQQLLTQKVEIQKETGNEERATILLFALADDGRIDEMFFQSFDKFSVPLKILCHSTSLCIPASIF